MKAEVWANIPRYHGKYKASNLGNILSVNYRNQYGVDAMLSLMQQNNGYIRIRAGNGKAELVHILVLEAFIGPRPKGHTANHKNGNKKDNRIENLEWVTPSENSKHKFRTGLHCMKGEGHNNSKLTDSDVREIRRLRSEGVKLKDVAALFKVNQGTTSAIANRKRWAHVKDLTLN